MTGEGFKKKDIIVLQDPQDMSNREINNYEHLKKQELVVWLNGLLF